ncbi:MAG: hypothetical protein U1E65_36080 [Myxococcota bacterium]
MLASSCTASWLDLQIADRDLPFLAPGRDFDGLSVAMRAEGCANASVRYPAAPLPATLSLVPGSCYRGAFSVQATALAGDRAVARSGWIAADFGLGAGRVLTATLTDLPGAQTLFSTGFEVDQAELGPLPVVASAGARGLAAAVSADAPLVGLRSALLGATLSSTGSRVLARAAGTNLLIAEGDQLVYTVELGAGAGALAMGVDLELSTGATAASLNLVDRSTGRPIHPGSAAGRRPGVREQWSVDLTPAAGARLVGVVFGSINSAGTSGTLELRLDEVSVVRP